MGIEVTTTQTTTTKVEVRDFASQDYLGKRFRSSLGFIGPDVASAINGLYGRIQETGAIPTGPPFLIAGPPMGGKMEIEVGAPCAPVPTPAADQHRGRLEAGKAAVAVHRGPYEKIAPFYPALFDWAAAHGYHPTGSPREVYLNGPNDVTTPDEYLTELVLPIG